MRKFLKRFAREEDGVTAVEYGLLASLIAIAVLVSVRALGTQLAATFNQVVTSLQGA